MSQKSSRVVRLPGPRTPVAEVQGTLALDLQPRQALPIVPAAEVVPINRAREDTIRRWAARFGQAAVEIVGGDRPPSQLLRWTTAEVYKDLLRRAQLVARAGQHRPGQARVQPVRPKVASVHVSLIDADTGEVSMRVKYGARSRAIAARFEWRDDRWICSALEFA